MNRLIQNREISVRELVSAHLDQIDRYNSKVNAVVTLLGDEALKEADAADAVLSKGESTGSLHGLPIAHKDLFAVVFAARIGQENAVPGSSKPG